MRGRWGQAMMFVFFLLTLSHICYGASNIASKVLMVPPEGFRFNEQTAKSNTFQKKQMNSNIRLLAMNEFYKMVELLRANGIDVIVFHQNKELPDAVFPNNWFSTHVNKNGETTLIVYPMLTSNRQAEVKAKKLLAALHENNVKVTEVIDMRLYTPKAALEGTGGVVLDRHNKIMYASVSSRTDPNLVKKLGNILGYKPVFFTSEDTQGHKIYHTNVMMSIAKDYAVICLECVSSNRERKAVINELKQSGKQIIAINQSQVRSMAGNVLELLSNHKNSLLVMSQQAYEALKPSQIKMIRKYSKIIPIELNTIESIGGGSARCMIAEIYS